MKKYLYLTEVEWANSWVYGGKIPLKLASTYLNDKRDGTLTPDENLIHKSEFPINEYQQYGILIKNSKDITITNSFYNGQKVPNVHNADYYREDGLILSFSNTYNKDIAIKLGKKSCVKINNMKRLKNIIDKQLQSVGQMRKCLYTNDHNRNHFLKSNLDLWQDEFRIFWDITKFKSIDVILPPNIATLIK